VIDIDQRQADRLRVMRAIFDAANGGETQIVRIVPHLQQRLGLTEQEIMDAAHYLIGEGLIVAPLKSGDYIIGVRLRHRGIKEMEQSLQSPDKPTHYFPPASYVVNNFHGDVIGSAVQSGSPGARQEVTFGDLDLSAVSKFLREYDARAAELNLPSPQAEELAADIDTIRTQVQSPRPKKTIIVESLRSARSILEITAGSATAIGLLDALKLIHL
jgi:hypothetical protein